jgi:HTH-type transcriptional regulator, sugar sensing transcriptional regulator
MDTTALKDAGLTDGEIKTYLALLEIGTSTVGPILKKSGITRSIIYRILEKLIIKGLVSYITKEKTKHYQAAQPDKLLDYIDTKEKQLQQNKTKIEKMIPQLILKQKMAKKSEASMYEGFKGLITAYDKRYEKLQKGDEVVLYGLPSIQPEYHHAYWKKANAKLDKLGIRSRLLYHPAVTDKNLKNRNSYKLCEARRMPFNIESPSWVMIYKDVTLIAIPQGDMPFAFEITSQQVADSFKNYFEWFWKQSKPFKVSKV